MHRLTFAGPRSAPTATPAKVQPRGRAGRVDDAASLECRASNPATYMSSPGPKARRRGRVVARSVRDGRIRPRPVSPSRGWGGSVGRSTGCPALARRCAGPGSGGGWRPVSDSEGAPGAWSERTCARGASRRVGCDTATGAVVATGPLHSSQRLGGHPSEFRWRPRSGNRAAGLFGFPLQSVLTCTTRHKRSLRLLLVAPVASR